MEKLTIEERIKNVSPNIDVIIWTFISKGTHQVQLELPKKSGGKDPAFNGMMYNETTFEVKKFTKDFPSVWQRKSKKEIYSYVSGTSEDKITATFHFENIEIIDFAHNPVIEVDLIKNPFDMDGSLPYLEILAVHLTNPLQYYLPVKGLMKFGVHKINLFTNPVPSPLAQ